MKKAAYSSLILIFLLALSSCTHVTFSSPLQKTTGELPVLIAPRVQNLQVEVADNRPVKEIYGGGLALIHSGVFIAYSADPGISLAQYLEKTGTEASQVLGFTPGTGGGILKVGVNEFWIISLPLHRLQSDELHRLWVAHRRLCPKSAELSQSRTFKLAYYENTTPAWSMEEVPKEAMSRIYSQAIWEALGKTVLESGSPPPDANGLGKLLQMIDTETNDRTARELIFWLGLVGRDDQQAREKLLQIFRNTQEQRRRQAAVEALGMLGVQEARAEIVDILSGARKIGYWSNNDAEEVFYLLKALFYLGEKNLQEYIPKQDFRARKKVEELVSFLNTGKIPELHPNAKPFFEEIQGELKKKN